MDVSTAAKNWGITEKTVLKYCKDNLIPYRIVNNEYVLNDEQLRPLRYIVKCKNYKTEYIRHYILMAIDKKRYINHSYLNCKPSRFDNIIHSLIIEKRIKSFGTVFPNDYEITGYGIEEMNQYKRQIVNGVYILINVGISMVSALAR